MKIITARGIRGAFMQTVEDLRKLWIEKLVTRFSSSSADEHYGWIGTPPGMDEVKGEVHSEELPEYELIVRNKTYESGLEFKREDIERDKTGQINLAKTEQWAAKCANHEMFLVSALMAAGTGTTLGKAYDGKAFFAANHVSHKSGTQKNKLTSSDVPALSVVDRTAPTEKEAVKAIMGVVSHILTLKDDQGDPINSNAKEFLVMAPPVMWQYLVPATVNTIINSGENNTIVSLRVDGFDISVAPNPLLTYTYEFDVYRTDGPLKPFGMQEEVPLEVNVLDINSEHYRLNNKVTAKAYTRKCPFYGKWEKAAHATLSTAG